MCICEYLIVWCVCVCVKILERKKKRREYRDFERVYELIHVIKSIALRSFRMALIHWSLNLVSLLVFWLFLIEFSSRKNSGMLPLFFSFSILTISGVVKLWFEHGLMLWKLQKSPTTLMFWAKANFTVKTDWHSFTFSCSWCQLCFSRFYSKIYI